MKPWSEIYYKEGKQFKPFSRPVRNAYRRLRIPIEYHQEVKPWSTITISGIKAMGWSILNKGGRTYIVQIINQKPLQNETVSVL